MHWIIVLFVRSLAPFDSGWYAVDIFSLIPVERGLQCLVSLLSAKVSQTVVSNAVERFSDAMCVGDYEAVVHKPEAMFKLDVWHSCHSTGQFLGKWVDFVPSLCLV